LAAGTSLIKIAIVNRRPALSGAERVDDVQFVFRATLQRIDENFQVVLKKEPEVLKNAAGQIGIIFFIEQLIKTRHTHDDADVFARLRSFSEKN
jgi:hypothetical protein